jgi:hypothetical protein
LGTKLKTHDVGQTDEEQKQDFEENSSTMKPFLPRLSSIVRLPRLRRPSVVVTTGYRHTMMAATRNGAGSRQEQGSLGDAGTHSITVVPILLVFALLTHGVIVAVEVV